MKLPWQKAIENTRGNAAQRRFPGKADQRFRHNMLFPGIEPSFQIDPGDKVFTIGSCFARNIEEALTDQVLPTTMISVPSRPELRPNAILNEYNPGSIAQRIQIALGHEAASDDTIVDGGDGHVDLLTSNIPPSDLARVKQLRSMIDEVYSHLQSSRLVIITLGMTEAWYDTVTNQFLNRMPPLPVLKATGDRYVFTNLNFRSCVELMMPALRALRQAGIKVLITVSPVPLGRTFTKVDPIVANALSKATLLVCARTLCERLPNADYFPSYEMVTSGGLSAFHPDNIHPLEGLVELVTRYMTDNYVRPSA